MNENMLVVEIGKFSLLLSFLVSAYAFTFSLLGAKIKNKKLISSTENAMHALCFLLILASAALLHALVNSNFSLAYVANYTSRSLETFFKVSAFWAGQSGSLLFWTVTLTISSSIAVLQNRHKNRDIMPYVVSTLSLCVLFFVSIMIFFEDSNPFYIITYPPQDGLGLNPLLQNMGMTWHPPTLFLGYVCFTIPFAFCIGALATGNLGNTWIKSTRRWTVFAWLMLSIGIVLGMQWAYMELGWGGYWAWDPVENASFMPWITGTAYLHSIMIQEKRGMLKVWNIVLVVLTFFLCIFGTFITRTDLVSSVHSFGKSELGPFFLIALAAILIVSYSMMAYRIKELKSKNELDSFLSREASFLLNNLVLLGMLVTVFIGTMFPTFSKVLTGKEISLRAPFFNKVNIPIGLTLMLLMGICPLIAWRKATAKNFKRNFKIPFIISIVFMCIILIGGVKNIAAITSYTICIFVTVTIIIEFAMGSKARHDIIGENYLLAFFKLIWKNKRRYGGYIVHTGIVIMFFGITASSAHKKEKNISARIGESFTLADYKFTFDNYDRFSTGEKNSEVAKISVFKKGTKVNIVYPERNVYKSKRASEDQTISEIGLHWNLAEDVYVIFAGIERNGSGGFHVFYNPFIVWIWIGGFIFTLGAIIAILPQAKKEISHTN